MSFSENSYRIDNQLDRRIILKKKNNYNTCELGKKIESKDHDRPTTNGKWLNSFNCKPGLDFSFPQDSMEV